jgi:hypothetical protein
MTRSVAAVVVFLLGLLAWTPGRAAAQAPLLGRLAPEIGGGPWLNSQPLTLRTLRGRVVLVDFWTSG